MPYFYIFRSSTGSTTGQANAIPASLIKVQAERIQDAGELVKLAILLLILFFCLTFLFFLFHGAFGEAAV